MIAPLGAVHAVLIAPAVRPDFLAKLGQRGADGLILDCEDAVLAAAKDEARGIARDAIPLLAEAGSQVMVRVNSMESPWFSDDIANGLAPEAAAVVVPKIETVDQLDELSAALDRAALPDLGVLVGIETALGVADARLLLSHPRAVGAYFGAEDFVADMGGVRTSSNDEVAFARAAVALAGRLGRTPVLDQVVTDFRNDAAFSREASEARNLGYGGKLCIHPSQVPLAKAAFQPSEADLDRARRLLEAYEKANAQGLAAIDFEGQMVDEPIAIQARRLLGEQP